MSEGLGMGYTGHLRAWGRQSAWGWSSVATSNLSVAHQMWDIWPMLFFRAAMKMTNEIPYNWMLTPATGCTSLSDTKSNELLEQFPCQGAPCAAQKAVFREKGKRAWVGLNGGSSGNGPGLNSRVTYTFVCSQWVYPSSVSQASCRVKVPTPHPHSANENAIILLNPWHE